MIPSSPAARLWAGLRRRAAADAVTRLGSLRLVHTERQAVTEQADAQPSDPSRRESFFATTTGGGAAVSPGAPPRPRLLRLIALGIAWPCVVLLLGVYLLVAVLVVPPLWVCSLVLRPREVC